MGVGDGATGLGLCTLGWGGAVFSLVFKRALGIHELSCLEVGLF